MKRTFQIYRYDPDKDAKPYMQTIEIELDGHERMLLDALLKLKAVDPSLAFRRSCREGVCGSDAMNINGKNGLACLTNLRSLPDVIVLKPLPGLPVVRDLMARPSPARSYNNVNLPHLEPGESPQVIECEPDNQPLDVRYRTQDGHIHYAGSYPQRPRTPGRDVDQCFAGSITISRLHL